VISAVRPGTSERRFAALSPRVPFRAASGELVQTDTPSAARTEARRFRIRSSPSVQAGGLSRRTGTCSLGQDTAGQGSAGLVAPGIRPASATRSPGRHFERKPADRPFSFREDEMREARCIEPSKPPAKGRSATFPPQARGCGLSPSLPRAPRHSGLTEKRIDVAAAVEDAQDIDTRLAQCIGDHHAALEGHKS
jgi:hypothetical protein